MNHQKNLILKHVKEELIWRYVLLVGLLYSMFRVLTVASHIGINKMFVFKIVILGVFLIVNVMIIIVIYCQTYSLLKPIIDIKRKKLIFTAINNYNEVQLIITFCLINVNNITKDIATVITMKMQTFGLIGAKSDIYELRLVTQGESIYSYVFMFKEFFFFVPKSLRRKFSIVKLNEILDYSLSKNKNQITIRYKNGNKTESHPIHFLEFDGVLDVFDKVGVKMQ